MTVPLADENRELVLQGLGSRERKGLLGREQERQRKHARREGGCTFFGRDIPRQTQKTGFAWRQAFQNKKRGGVVKGEEAE